MCFHGSRCESRFYMWSVIFFLMLERVWFLLSCRVLGRFCFVVAGWCLLVMVLVLVFFAWGVVWWGV